MKVAIVYIHHPNSGDYGVRFVRSYNENPAGIEHESVVVLNGLKATAEIRCLFASLRNVTFLERNGDGWDIGGFQEAAQKFPCDLMVFFGSSTYFRGPGWLLRMLQAFLRHGPALYGVMGNRGDHSVRVHPHIRTTGFWTTPDLMNRYPHRVTRPEQRYPFEHGNDCFTNWIKSQGLKPWVVAWSGDYPESEWDSIPNGFHKNDQSALLCGDRLSEPPYHPIA